MSFEVRHHLERTKSGQWNVSKSDTYHLSPQWLVWDSSVLSFTAMLTNGVLDADHVF